MYWLTCEMIFATLKTMVRVLPVCMRLPHVEPHVERLRVGDLVGA